MIIILDQYTLPERGTLRIQESITINVSAEEARRAVDRWLMGELSYLMGAEEPTLVIGARAIWRVPVYLSAPHLGRVGTVGAVDVDVLTGEMIDPRNCKAQLKEHAMELVTDLPTYRPRVAGVNHLATNTQTTRKAGRPAGNPSDLVT